MTDRSEFARAAMTVLLAQHDRRCHHCGGAVECVNQQCAGRWEPRRYRSSGGFRQREDTARAPTIGEISEWAWRMADVMVEQGRATQIGPRPVTVCAFPDDITEDADNLSHLSHGT